MRSGKPENLHSTANHTRRDIRRRQTRQSHEWPQDFQIDTEELLSHRLEIMVAAKPAGLANRDFIYKDSSSATRDCGHNPPIEWMWRMYKISHEVYRGSAKLVGDLGRQSLVAARHEVQPAQWRLQGELLPFHLFFQSGRREIQRRKLRLLVHTISVPTPRYAFDVRCRLFGFIVFETS